jgi:hypothetical protein
MIPGNEVEEQLRREQGEREQGNPLPPTISRDLPTIHYTELRNVIPGSLLAVEWNYYLSQLGRLMAEGNEGKWILVKGEEIVGIWNTQAETEAVRVERFLMQTVLMKQILVREPNLRIGYNRLCRS